MQSDNNIAFKEWGVVCDALAAGRQTIILRKGGINEGRDGFRVEHAEFWLLPTRFHQTASALKPGVTIGSPSNAEQPTKFSIDLYAVVHEVFHVDNLARLKQITAEHILSDETIDQRFHYRHPGLFVLAVRIYRVPHKFDVVDSPYIAGCKSWVELPERFSTRQAASVLAEKEFELHVRSIQHILNP